jgi:hypothetical protein
MRAMAAADIGPPATFIDLAIRGKQCNHVAVSVAI